LARWAFDLLDENRLQGIQKREEANRICAANTTRKYLILWRKVLKRKQERDLLRQLEFENIADKFCVRFTKKFYFWRWRESIHEAHETREKNKIGEEMKSKVKMWLTDFRLQTEDLAEWNDVDDSEL
jgi:hypothetical protein